MTMLSRIAPALAIFLAVLAATAVQSAASFSLTQLLSKQAQKLIAEETVDAEGFESLFADLPPKEGQPSIPSAGADAPAPGVETGLSPA